MIMDSVFLVFPFSSPSWLWVGVLCGLFFLCGGTIAWVLGYHAGFAEGRDVARKEQVDVDLPRV